MDVGLLLTALVQEPVLLVLLVLVGGGGDPLVAVPGGLLLLQVQQISSGYVAKGAHYSPSVMVYLRDSQLQSCVLMALATSLSRALAVVTMVVFTG